MVYLIVHLSGPHAVLGNAFDEGLNVGFEWAP